MSEIGEQLRIYVQRGCEESFRRLIETHAGLVYAAALRKLNGDAAAATDVAQNVFTIWRAKPDFYLRMFD